MKAFWLIIAFIVGTLAYFGPNIILTDVVVIVVGLALWTLYRICRTLSRA